jgi:hypothetical protein
MKEIPRAGNGIPVRQFVEKRYGNVAVRSSAQHNLAGRVGSNRPAWVAFFVPIQHNADKEAQNTENSTTEQTDQSTGEVSLKT